MQLKVGDKIETVRFFHCYKRGVDRVFVDHPLFLEKVWNCHFSCVNASVLKIQLVMFLFPLFVFFCFLIFIILMIQVWAKTGSQIYGPRTGVDYKDNQLRFSLLCQVKSPKCDIVSIKL